jgi:hypothetical protein
MGIEELTHTPLSEAERRAVEHRQGWSRNLS